MRTRLVHAAPFLGFLLLTCLGAFLPLCLQPVVERGAWGITGSMFTDPGLLTARSVGVLLCVLPFLVVLFYGLSHRFPALRSGGSMALLGCGVGGLYLLYALSLCFPLFVRGALQVP